MKEKLISTGEKILTQLGLEASIDTPDKSIGYFEGVLANKEAQKWILRNEKAATSKFVNDINGCAIGTQEGQADTIYTKTNTIFRDSPLGRFLAHGVGSHSHKTPKGTTVSIDIDVLSKYATDGRGDAINGDIVFRENKQEFKFSSLIKDLRKLTDLENKISEDKQKLEEAEKETAEAIELSASIEKKEKEVSDLKQKVQKHIAKEVALRDQPILDEYQEEVKRSKILDGTLIINGGPGTGKTTSLIQRINYLTAKTIEEEIGELNAEQQEVLFQQKTSWVFYSPTELLKTYLKGAMEAEGLLSTEESVRTWDNHRKVLLRQTGLINTEKQRPFISKSIKAGTFFMQGSNVFQTINDLFLDYLLERQSAKVNRMHDEQVFKKLSAKSQVESIEKHRVALMQLAMRMRDSSLPALKYRKIESWVGFFINFNKEFIEEVKAINSELNEDIKMSSSKLFVKVKHYGDLLAWISEIVREEIRNRNAQLTIEDDEDEEDDEEELIDQFDESNLDLIISGKLTRLVRNYALYLFDRSNKKVSSKNKVLLEKLEPLMDQSELASLGLRLYFKKNFERPTKGLETNLLGGIPTTYKQFRRTIYKNNSECITNEGLVAFEKNLKNENKHLYKEEADYLLSIIFRLCKRIYRDRKQYYKNSKHPYILAFKDNMRGVVAIDEATDFSIWELAAMSNLSHPLFNSVTLSGDLMQRLTQKGISSWSDYTSVYPNTEIRDLKIAYRQTARLLKIASEIYSWNVDSEANFKSHFKEDALDPSPLMMVSDEEEDKHQWLVDRIVEIQKLYGTEFPSVAIFVKDDAQVVQLTQSLNAYEELEEIGVDVVACVNGQILGSKQSVRIYSIEYIKGLEFGAVFFHNLDDLSLNNDTLTNKYIYVGLSRANLFLGITMSDKFSDDLEFLKAHFGEGKWDKIGR